MSVLDLEYNYSSLSVRDLLDAREAYHWHLISKANVIGTAVGRYLIRRDDPWPQGKGQDGKESRATTRRKPPRTLGNSEVRDYSWPCILAFVREWEPEEAFSAGGRYNPAEIVPKTLYLSDGRAVPVCVVQADETPAGAVPTALAQVSPLHKFGGGMPLYVDIQGVERFATAGCLVTDGHLTYTLTARHVCGEEGTPIMSNLRSGLEVVGTSSDLQLTREAFSLVYPEFPGHRSFQALDVGLVRLNNLDDWTSNTYGLPPVGPLADVHEHNVSLRLIDCPVIGAGAASGLLHGTIKALYYRYRSVGGYDYVGDLLIAPEGDNHTRPGDSGMIWHLDVTPDRNKTEKVPLQSRDLRPLAIEWGGQVLGDSGRRTVFGIATNLSSACRLLDVELVTNLSRGVSGYWGREGHYTIANYAIRLIKDKRLKKWLEANLSLLTFDIEAMEDKGFDKSVGQISAANEFVPLADVPDEIWKKLTRGKNAREGGRDTGGGGGHGSSGPEHPCHYADIDAAFGPNDETWRALCLADPDANMTVDAWLDFYKQMSARAKADGDAEAARQYNSSLKQGLLPFRLWQFFKAMVDFVAAGDVVGYLTAAGIAAHYMGDVCQPLHGSIYADGDSSRTVKRHHPKTGVTDTVPYGKDVHSAYESAMLSLKAKALHDKIEAKLPNSHGMELLDDGQKIATAVVKLMDEVAQHLPPMEVLDSFENAGAGKNQTTYNAMWEDLGDATAEVMAWGSAYLALFWESAWKAGGGDDVAATKLKKLDQDDVRARYIDTDFIPSVVLKDIQPYL